MMYGEYTFIPKGVTALHDIFVAIYAWAPPFQKEADLALFGPDRPLPSMPAFLSDCLGLEAQKK